MRFIVQKNSISRVALKLSKANVVHLVPDNWDDNFKFKTSFRATFYSEKYPDRPISLGGMKILKLNQKEGTNTFDLLKDDQLLEFDELGNDYCSLGWNEDYYKNLEVMGRDIYVEYLEALNDVFHKPSKAHKFTLEGNPGFELSLIRDSFAAHLFREAQRKEQSSSYISDDVKFDVAIHLDQADKPHKIDFDFSAHKGLPNRIFVLVGKNGVGKTQIMGRLGIKISGFESNQREGVFEKDFISERGFFKNIVAISFNAFDDFEIPTEEQQKYCSYRYWGLRGEENKLLHTDELIDRVCDVMADQPYEIKEEFDEYIERIADDIKFSDDSLSSAQIKKKIKEGTSAGQRFLIVTIAGLLSFLEDHSLLLFDEPETHLHPSFLSTLISIIGDILERHESYAIIATHSPIVLQQIPSRYIRSIKRAGNLPSVSRIPIETFGENLTEISMKVFDVSEKEKDFSDVFIKLLRHNNNDPDKVSSIFDDELGISAQSILYSLANEEEEDA